MKTPRDLLFARHQVATPKLDAIRRQMLAELNHQDTETPSWASCLATGCLGGLTKLWEELILPSRRIWTGLATIWILIFAVNVAQREPAPNGKAYSTPMMLSARDQQRWVNELFADHAIATELTPPKNSSPRPRTKTATFLLT
jgi:hypothetical protein